MKITLEMLHASTKKAVALGVLPRSNVVEDIATNAEIMQEILRAALDPDASDNATADGNGRDNESLSQ